MTNNTAQTPHLPQVALRMLATAAAIMAVPALVTAAVSFLAVDAAGRACAGSGDQRDRLCVAGTDLVSAAGTPVAQFAALTAAVLLVLMLLAWGGSTTLAPRAATKPLDNPTTGRGAGARDVDDAELPRPAATVARSTSATAEIAEVHAAAGGAPAGHRVEHPSGHRVGALVVVTRDLGTLRKGSTVTVTRVLTDENTYDYFVTLEDGTERLVFAHEIEPA